jgi:hypothetical protein
MGNNLLGNQILRVRIARTPVKLASSLDDFCAHTSAGRIANGGVNCNNCTARRQIGDFDSGCPFRKKQEQMLRPELFLFIAT